MEPQRSIKPISYIKSHSADIVKQVNSTGQPVFITQNGEAKAVILDPQSYDNMQKALGLLKLLSQGENDISKKEISSHDDVMNSLEQRLFPDVPK